MQHLFFLFVVSYFFACAPSASSSQPEKAIIIQQTSNVEKGPKTAAEMVADGYRRYGLEKGILYFRMEGAVQGTETIYFDHWGWREARHINTKADVGSFKEEVFMIQYLEGERRYDYNPETNKAVLFESPQVQQSAMKYQTRDMVKVSEIMMENMGAVRSGAGKVAGVDCEIWKMERYKTTLSLWKGLTVKEESFINNIPVRRVALLIKQDEDPPSDKLLIPANAVIVKN